MQRRNNGDGSIFQVADNKWVAKIYVGQNYNGKPRVKQFSGKNETIVRKKLREYKKSSEFTECLPVSDYTVETYFSKWLKTYQYYKLKPLSFDRLESTVINHIYPYMGNLKLSKVTRDRIQSHINYLAKDKGLSYSSIKKVYNALNACYKHAVISDVVAKNPCLGVVMPLGAENSKQIISFTEEEVNAFKKEATKSAGHGRPTYLYGHAFILILNTGLRMGEALSLRWEDIDFRNKTVTVSKNNILSKKRDKNGNKAGGYELKTQGSTKTSNGNRIIPINRSAEEALRMLKINNSSQYVIVNGKQNQVLPSNFERSFHSILDNAGIPRCGMHVLRHTFASMLFSKGVDVKIVSKLLGHSSVKITYDTYVHLFEKDISHATSVLD